MKVIAALFLLVFLSPSLSYGRKSLATSENREDRRCAASWKSTAAEKFTAAIRMPTDRTVFLYYNRKNAA
jgi:hypothetical protein